VTRTPDLSGKRVLVVEDEFFIADEIRHVLEQHGAEVVGPAGRRGGRPRPGGEGRIRRRRARHQPARRPGVRPGARAARCGHAFVFATGYANRFVPPEFAGTPHFEKPLHIQQFLGAVAAACGPA
jgi:hypothetical protein